MTYHKNNLNKFHKLRIYELFKTLEMERYLRGVNDVYKRMLLTKFGCGILSLRIETGRYENSGMVNKRGIPNYYQLSIEFVCVVVYAK